VFEYLELRFNSKKVRKTGTIFYIMRTFISAAIFLYGPATSLSQFTGIDEKIAIGIVGLIGTFYTTIGKIF
jgi:SSS family solute:Na+ symporter